MKNLYRREFVPMKVSTDGTFCIIVIYSSEAEVNREGDRISTGVTREQGRPTGSMAMKES